MINSMTKQDLEGHIEELEELISLLKHDIQNEADLIELEAIERFEEVYSMDDIAYELERLEEELHEALESYDNTDWDFNGDWWSYNGVSQSDFI